MTASRIPSVSAVLPAYNEVAVIAQTVRRTHAALVACGVSDLEVIVVDDGSTDGTAAAVATVAEQLGRVVLVRHDRNRGYGGALRTGFETAGLEAVFLMDSDAQFDPADLALLLPHWGEDTLVAGYRARRQDPLPRRLNHAAFFALVRVALGPSLRDVNCAFKLFGRSLGVGLRAEGAMISTELALRARHLGWRVVEVPVPHHPRTTGTATGADPRVVARAFAELWRMRREGVAAQPRARSGRRGADDRD
jgi:glycosyltransferase involved in cell wall biosynthesis